MEMKIVRYRYFILVATLFALSCGELSGSEKTESPGAIMLTYRCEVPDGLARDITLHEKDGIQRSADKHAIYRTSHERGWFWVVHGYINNNGRFPKEPLAGQEFGIMTTARKIGILEATAAIMKLELEHDPSSIVAALKTQFVERQRDETDPFFMDNTHK